MDIIVEKKYTSPLTGKNSWNVRYKDNETVQHTILYFSKFLFEKLGYVK